MKKTTALCALLCMVLMPLGANAQSLHAVQYKTQYGDAMGYTNDETATKKTETLYGKDNRIERQVQTGRNEDGSWNLINYYRYDYSQTGNLEMTNSLQYGLYDQNNWSFKASNDTVDYKYNDKGLLVQQYERATKTTHDYEYDEQGRLVKDSRTRYYQYQDMYKTDLVITYSDFTVGGPQTISAEATSSYNNYTGKITYDAQGNKTSELHWTIADEPVENYAEYWVYDENGNLTLYEKKTVTNGQETNGTKVEYEQIDANTTCSRSYSWGTDHWSYKPGSKTITEYSDFDTKYVPTNLKVVGDDAHSQVSVSFTASVSDATYNIYRDGILVANTAETEYTDTDVKNGSHEYFVQTVLNGKNLNTSEVATVNIARDYPHATNFHATTSTLDSDGIYHVGLTWTNPAITDDMKFVNTNIVKIGKYYSTPLFDTGEEITDTDVNTCTVSFGIDAVMTLYVQTRYACGTVSSDTITVDATKILGKTTEVNRKLRVVETYGDAMGETSGMSKKAVTYYGQNNRIEREAKYSNAVNTGDPDAIDLTIYEYTSYIYDEAGMLTKSYTNQYGRYDYGNMGFRAAQDTTYYENNVEGQKIKEYNDEGYTTYEYSNNGSLTKQYSVEFGTENIEQTIEYSNFAGKNLPQTTISTGTRSSANYKFETTYNGDGKKLTERKSTWSNYKQEYIPSQFEKWEYDETGELTVDSVFTIKTVNDIETLVVKSYTTYTPEEGNSNRVAVVKKVWDDILGKFGNPKTTNVYEYSEINAEKYAPVLEVNEVDEKLNTVELSVELPYNLQNGMTALNVYRNGIEIAHCIGYFDDDHYTTDEYGYNGKWTYVDEAVPNGTYDYYVEYAKFNSTLSDEAQVGNISNVVFHTFYTELPKATGLKVTGARYTVVMNTDSDEPGEELNAFATLEWQPAENAEVFGIKQYRVMVAGMNIGENDDVEDPLATSYELDLRGRDSLTVCIMSMYPYGYSFSDSILVTEDDIKNIADGIENLTPALSKGEGECYNTLGQRVNKDAKGIIITRKKKYLVK